MIRKITIICLLLLSSITMTSQTKSAAYLSNTSQPWGQNSNIMALNAVYGADWTQYFYNSAVIAEIFVPGRTFVWLEGGNADTSLMLNVINSNTALIESWVSNGGILLISAATNQFSTPYSVGFGITSQQVYTTKVVAADVNHPFFANSTYTPILAPSYTGSYIAHNVHTGAGLTPILSSSEGTGDVFAEKPFGSGLVLFSGLTTPFFLTSSEWQPQPQMTNMLYAMIDYARNAGMTAVANVTQTVGEFGYTFSENGTTSYILVPGGATPPTAAQVAAGVNYADVTIFDAKTVSTTGGVSHTFNLSDLIPDTNYDIYVVTFYFDGDSNVYSDVGKTNFKTEPNDLPVGSAIANQTTCINGSISGLSLNITDAYPGDNVFSVTGSSSNTSLVPNNNIVVTGTGSSRSIAITPSTGISGTSTITISMTDSLGAIGTQTFNVTFNDLVNPTITAPAAINATTNSGCTATGVSLGTPVTADNCSVASVMNDHASTTYPLGVTTVTWTVTDVGGNTATATQTVTVTDNVNPTITAPPAVAINTACGATAISLGTPVTADNCSVASVTNDAPALFPLGDTTITWTVTDGAGRTATATQLVSVGDTVFPVIKTKNATVYLNNLGQAIVTPAMIDNGTTDNCDFSLIVSPNNFVCGNVGVNNVILIATDASGNQTIRPAFVTVVDNLPPTITAPAAVSAIANASCGATGVNLGTPTIADNCYIDTPAVNNAPATFPLGATTVTWTVTDRNGNSATATQIVTVTDNQDPTIATLNPISVNADAGVCTYASSQLTAPTAADNCSIASIVSTPVILNLGANTVTWTATDGSGNSATSTQTVTVIDTQKPTIALSNVIVSANASCEATAVELGAEINDNCSVANTSNDAPTTFPLGNTTVTWTVTDGSGNTETATQTVTVVDNQNPTIATLDPISVNADSGVDTYASSQLTTPTAADNCSVATVVASPASLVLGENTVTWTVTDGSENTATSIQTVTVIDNQEPTIATAEPISVNADDAVCTYASSQLTAPATSDNFSVESVLATPASLDLGENTVTWTVTDGSGLTATSTQTVTVIDAQNPTIVTLDPISVNADADVCTYASSQLTAPAVADNCSVATVVATPASLNLGENTVTWTVTDGSGNTATSTQIVTVIDTQKPTITTLDIVVSANASCNATGVDLGIPTTTDNCSVSGTSNDAPTTFPLGDTTVTWTVTDGSGNTATTTQTVTVEDTTLPTITAPAAVTGNVNASCGATGVTLGNAITADNCSVASVTNDAPVIFPLGVTTVTWTVTDGSGKTATATQQVTMGDTIFPVVKTKNATVYLNSVGQAIILPSMIDNGTTDNCDFTLTVSPNNLVCANIGQNNVLLIATDASGNQSFKPATITLVDTIPPSITAPSNVSVTANASCGATGVALGFPVTSDNCYIDTPAVNNAPATFPIGVTTVTWTVTDRNGNSSTATQTVTVTDITAPVVLTKDITIRLDSTGNATLAAAEIDNGSSDNCGISSMTLSQDTFTISDIGIKTLTLTVTDNSGNTASATAQVTVEGTLATTIPKRNTFLIYPIPFDNYINITLPDSYTEDAIYIRIFDLNGKVVYNEKHTVENNNVTISDLSKYSDGNYYMNLLDSHQNVIQSKHILKKSKY
jgi:hypothetical protein